MRDAQRPLARAAVIALLSCSAAACGARSSLETLDPPARPGTCGDGLVTEGEPCDDGNDVLTDACVKSCTLAACGDGHLRQGFEACDDGNSNNVDACRNNCALPTCGDGVLDLGEECDDANGIDTDGCPSLCLAARCGDGFVQAGVEECDSGAANADRPAYLVTQAQSGLSQRVAPVERPGSVESFYSYSSASAHTGMEALEESRLFLYRDSSTGTLSLITLHGIDLEPTGQDQPKSRVMQSFSHLPEQVYIAVADDDEEELIKDSTISARGDWSFHHNSDGGVFAGFPSPGTWSVDIDSTFEQGVNAWGYVDASGELVPLTFNATTTITSYGSPSECRLDCTVPRCGDGILDGGELCDDGNTTDGDGCPADCQ